jgi:small subunit ribosomal protein S20
MPQHKSAEKRIRTSARRHERNKADITKMKKALKKVRGAGTKADGEIALKKIVILLDQLAAKKVIHRNKASNQKSKLTKVVNKMK